MIVLYPVKGGNERLRTVCICNCSAQWDILKNSLLQFPLQGSSKYECLPFIPYKQVGESMSDNHEKYLQLQLTVNCIYWESNSIFYYFRLLWKIYIILSPLQPSASHLLQSTSTSALYSVSASRSLHCTPTSDIRFNLRRSDSMKNAQKT